MLSRICGGGCQSAERGREFDVFFIGLTLSPAAYFAQYYLKCEGLDMITASHNPDGWSGFKLACGYSKTLEPDDKRSILSA
ncbi:MAG: hypothetical protein V8S82_07370 [Eubacteriales bacterium]